MLVLLVPGVGMGGGQGEQPLVPTGQLPLVGVGS